MAKKILIIEDEAILRNLLQKKLKGCDYDVLIAEDGESGIEKMREIKPDLILLDIVMPKIDGYGVLKKMEEEKSLKDIPVIVISNSGQPVEIERIKKMGVKDWLIKTDFDPQEVVKKVIKIIGQ